MKILIESDGLGTGTKVTHVESGADLSACISGMEIHAQAGDIVTAELMTVLAGLKIVASVRPKGSQNDVANALYILADRISKEEIFVNVFQTDTTIQEVTGLNQRWKEFMSTGSCIFLMWEPIKEKEEKENDARNDYCR